MGGLFSKGENEFLKRTVRKRKGRWRAFKEINDRDKKIIIIYCRVRLRAERGSIYFMERMKNEDKKERGVIYMKWRGVIYTNQG